MCRRDDYCHVSNKGKSFFFFVFYVCLCYVSPSVSFFYLAMSVFLLFWPVHTFASSCLMFCQVSVYVAVPSSFYSNECLALLLCFQKTTLHGHYTVRKNYQTSEYMSAPTYVSHLKMWSHCGNILSSSICGCS